MRQVWQIMVLLMLFVGWSRAGSAQCAEDLDAVGALADARNARGVLSDLNLMRAWNTRIRQEMNDRAARREADEPEVVLNTTSSLWWSDSFDGFRLCETDAEVSLDRTWWGAHARYEEVKTGLGYELFFLTARDELGFPKGFGDYEYGWRHRIAGARLSYRDWVAVEVGTIDIKAPTRVGEGVHEGSAYIGVSSPLIGVGFDLLVHPGTRRLNMLMLGVRRASLPWMDMTVSAHGGWLEDERKGVAGLALSAFRDVVSLQFVVEGTPVRLRSVSMRIENGIRSNTEDWIDAGIAPFVEVSAYNGGAFAEATGRALVPGAATGFRMFVTTKISSVGLEFFTGVNRAEELNRLTRVVDHLHWGGRVYLTMAL